jgi:endonuclease I
VPEGYYTRAENLKGTALKEALNEIIKGHVEYPYTSSSTDTWDILKETDRDTANPENVILIYSGWSVNAAQEYNNARGWSREHVWAKSHGDFGTSKGAGTDVHHLRPCDISVNSARGNDDFDNGGNLHRW